MHFDDANIRRTLFLIEQTWQQAGRATHHFTYISEIVLQRNEWRKFRAPKGVVTPKGRRSHTATVFQDSLYIYGGYQDLKGSTSELWAFHFGKYDKKENG